VQGLVAPLLVVSFALVLAVHVPHVGVTVNGAKRWLGSGPFQFQPSELLKLALVLYGATLLARRPARVHDLRELAKPLLFVVGAACLLVATQPDLGTAMVIAFTTCALLVAAGIPLRNLAVIGGSALVVVALYAIALLSLGIQVARPTARTSSPGTRLKSPGLDVATVRSWVSAVAAIHRSCVATISPAASRCAQMPAWTRAVCVLMGSGSNASSNPSTIT
jgi:cell division protein FtsW (lipid II flippase)